MKVLIATDKPFAKIAVEGIRQEIEAAGFELALLEKYTEKQQLLDAVVDADAIIIRSDIIDAEVIAAAQQLAADGQRPTAHQCAASIEIGPGQRFRAGATLGQ